MARRLTREEAIAEFDALHAQLEEVRNGDNHKHNKFIAAADRIRSVADHGALLVSAVPIGIDLGALWRYDDKGMLPEDGGAPIHAFHRRLSHYHGAAKRIVDILRNDVLWSLHEQPDLSVTVAPPAEPAGTAHDRQYAVLLELMQPLLRLLEWTKRYIELLGDDGGVSARIARSSHRDHFVTAGAELQASWSRHEPAIIDGRVRAAFAVQRASALAATLMRLTDADRDQWDATVRALREEALKLDEPVRAAIDDYQRGTHLKASGPQPLHPEHEFMVAAIEEARKSRTEPNKTPLFVGAVVVKDGKIIARGHRGQHKLGEHAEFTLLERNLPAPGTAANATLYCTLEPCIVRNPPKSPCAEWIKRHRITRVVIGVIDPDRRIRGGGVKLLRQAGIDVALFPGVLANEIEAMNGAFEREKDNAAIDSDRPARGFHHPSTVPESFYEWRRWERPTAKLDRVDAVFDKAWLETGESGGRVVWDVCVVNADQLADLALRVSSRADQMTATKTSHRADRYTVVLAVVGDTPGSPERGAQSVVEAIATWTPKLNIAVLVGWIAKHHFVTDRLFDAV